MTKSQRNALRDHWAQYGLNVEDGTLDYAAAFGRAHEVILEIGFGMGDALAVCAERAPEKDFLGVEVHSPGVGSLLSLVAAKSLKNVRIYNEDVNEVLMRCIPDDSLSGVNLFFPDPWHKKRHHKRRLIQPEFVALLWCKLKVGAKLHLATDWQHYAEQMMVVLSDHPGLNNTEGVGNFIKNKQMRPATKFEKRGQRLGHGVWDLMFVKTGDRSGA